MLPPEGFPDLQYPQNKSDINSPRVEVSAEESKSEPKKKAENQKQSNVAIQVFGKQVSVKLPRNELDNQFMLSLRYSRWDGKQYCWIVPHNERNLTLLKAYFKERISEFVLHERFEVNTAGLDQRKIAKHELLIIKTNQGRLKLIFGHNAAFIGAIKKIPFADWNSQNKWWTVPFADKFLRGLKAAATAQNWTITYEEEPGALVKPRISQFDIPNYRTCPEVDILKLKELRYSERTIQNYSGLFEEFTNFCHKVDIERIDESMITAFMRYLVIERKVSHSYQNQAINAIKFYYERVLGGQRKVYLVDRPRTEKKLPEVLSEEEMVKLLQATEDIKHKAILMLAYSAGLRVVELVNVKIKDIDSKKLQVRIEQGKNKKDRYSILSLKLLEVLRSYFQLHKPKEHLFEGMGGGMYAARSIQSIMKESLKKAGIKKKRKRTYVKTQLCDPSVRKRHRSALYPKSIGPRKQQNIGIVIPSISRRHTFEVKQSS